MDRGVVSLAPVVPSTHHHGSMYNYPPPQLMILKSGSVLMEGVHLKILQYNLWNCMSNELSVSFRYNTLELDITSTVK